MAWKVTATNPRIDRPALRERIDLAAVATHLMGPAPGRRGERGRRLWWNCPFHEDHNPSFCVDPDKPWWRCFGCHEKGDAAALVMRVQSMSFPEAVRWLADFVGGVAPTVAPRPRPKPKPSAKAPTRPEAGPDYVTGPEAEALVEAAADRLWTPEGAAALAALRGRGLADETIQAARLGVATRGRPGRPAGVVIPWHVAGRLSLVKVRTASGRPKYREVFRDRPALYVARPILPGRPVVIAEVELDAILLGQETADWPCGVVTTGSASHRPDASRIGPLLAAWPWIVATDADGAGDCAADAWHALAPGRCRRLRPPGPGKDWTDAHAAGWNRLRYHLAPILMTPPTWVDLAAMRWGEPSDADEPPGLLAGF